VNKVDLSYSIVKAILYLSGISLVLYILSQVKVLIAYLIIASILSLIFKPIFDFLNKRLKFNLTFSSIFTLLFIVIIFLGIISLLIPLVLEQGKNLSLLNVNNLEIKVSALFSELSFYLSNFDIDFDNTIIDFKSLSKSSIETIPKILNSIGSILGSFTMGVLSVLFITFFLLRDSIKIEKWIILLFPSKMKKRADKSVEEIKQLLSRYFRGLLIQISILFVIYTVLLLIFKIEDAIVIAFLCALLNLIPYIGPIIGLVLMTFLTMTSNLGLDFSSVIVPKTIYISIGYIFAQLIDNFFSQPYIFSNSVKSHPLEIFIIILVGGFLFGIGGMIIAIPLYTATKVIGKVFFNENRFINKLTKNL
jgi:predicted PurR-regulated permease PerM|tara:strand:+ start:2669 stop:3757 length:1089 start_codon:yes stop_codon:yes gene_type:complete